MAQFLNHRSGSTFRIGIDMKTFGPVLQSINGVAFSIVGTGSQTLAPMKSEVIDLAAHGISPH